MSEKKEERRRYFRVMDRVGLRVNLVSDSEMPEGSSEKPVESPAQRLVRVNSAINKHLAGLKKRDESLATLLGLLNHKMDLLVVDLDRKSSDESIEEMQYYRKHIMSI